MRALSLFSGLGGIDLAGEWAGIQTVAFCEREPFPRRVLATHWPGIPIYDDVCTLTKEVLEQDGILSGTRAIDIVSAGFPCQPFSNAGQRGGTDDERYLWPEVVRILQDVQPPWFIGENVAGILSMAEPDGGIKVESRTIQPGPEEDFYEAIFTQQERMLFGHICKDLEDIGYQVQPFVIPAAAVGAKHLRERVFIVAYSERFQRRQRSEYDIQRGRTGEAKQIGLGSIDGAMGNAAGAGLSERRQSGGTEGDPKARTGLDSELERSGENVAYSNEQHGNDGGHGAGAICGELLESPELQRSGEDVADPHNERQQERNPTSRSSRVGYSSGGIDERRIHSGAGTTQSSLGGSLNELSAWMDGRGVNPLDAFAEYIADYPQPAPLGMDQYSWEPPRVATGVKERTARLKGLGNAVDPLQIYPVLAAVKMINDRLDSNEGLL